MRVFLVVHGEKYQPGEVIEVFTEKEKAKEYIEKEFSTYRHHSNDYYVDEMLYYVDGNFAETVAQGTPISTG